MHRAIRHLYKGRSQHPDRFLAVESGFGNTGKYCALSAITGMRISDRERCVKIARATHSTLSEANAREQRVLEKTAFAIARRRVYIGPKVRVMRRTK